MIAKKAEKDALDAAYFLSTKYSRKLQSLFSDVTPHPISADMCKDFFTYYDRLLQALASYNPNRNFFSRHNKNGFEVQLLGNSNPLTVDEFMHFLRTSNENVQKAVDEFEKAYPEFSVLLQEISMQSTLVVVNYQKASVADSEVTTVTK